MQEVILRAQISNGYRLTVATCEIMIVYVTRALACIQ